MKEGCQEPKAYLKNKTKHTHKSKTLYQVGQGKFTKKQLFGTQHQGKPQNLGPTQCRIASYMAIKNFRGQQDGPASKQTRHQAQCPELRPQEPHSRKT